MVIAPHDKVIIMRSHEALDQYSAADYTRTRYSPDYNINVLRPFGKLLRASSDSPMMLDLASGTGRAADYLETFFGVKVVRTDLSKDGLSLASGKRVLALADTLPFIDEAFDAVHMKDAVVHIPDTRALFQEISRVLKPSGNVLMVSAYPDRGNSFYYREVGSERSRWVDINNQSDYIRQAQSLTDKEKVSSVSAPYYSTDPSVLETSANLVGLRLIDISEWMPQDKADWYGQSPRPVNRFVMHFKKIK